MTLKRLIIPGAAAMAWSRLVPDARKEQIRTTVKGRLPERIGPLVVTHEQRSRRKTFVLLGLGAFVGGVIAYFFDPDNGRRRRARTRDMTAARARRASDRSRKMRVRVENKAAGLQAELRPRTDEGVGLNDPTLEQKIRSEVLRDFPTGKVSVNVQEGTAVLRGELDRPDQIKALEAAVSAVPGVRGVDNLTHLRNTPSP